MPRNIPIHGICSLDAIAFDYAKPCVVVTDARRKELYWARYEDKRIGEPQVSKPEDLLAQFPDSEFVGRVRSFIQISSQEMSWNCKLDR